MVALGVRVVQGVAAVRVNNTLAHVIKRLDNTTAGRNNKDNEELLAVEFWRSLENEETREELAAEVQRIVYCIRDRGGAKSFGPLNALVLWCALVRWENLPLEKRVRLAQRSPSPHSSILHTDLISSREQY